ncbi:MAG TPA: hypothetical protein VNI20_13910 [Fimbriimonadaceae bacterium]|nr:hypothetical protein [Fimbriimonadaceae bacterium]
MNQEDKVLHQIKTGDTVLLRGGGVPMTVIRTYADADGVPMAETEYWDGERNRRSTVRCDALVLSPAYVEED